MKIVDQRTTVMISGAQDIAGVKAQITVAGRGVIVHVAQRDHQDKRAPILLNADTVKDTGQATGRAVRELTVGRTRDAVRPSTTKRTSLLKKRERRRMTGLAPMPTARRRPGHVLFRATKCL